MKLNQSLDWKGLGPFGGFQYWMSSVRWNLGWPDDWTGSRTFGGSEDLEKQCSDGWLGSMICDSLSTSVDWKKSCLRVRGLKFHSRH